MDALNIYRQIFNGTKYKMEDGRLMVWQWNTFVWVPSLFG
jgi:hypothetical protein